MFIYLKIHILGKWSMSLVFLVEIMIVYLGIASMLTIRKNRGHSHQPNHGQSYSYGLNKKAFYFNLWFRGNYRYVTINNNYWDTFHAKKKEDYIESITHICNRYKFALYFECIICII